MSRPRPPAAPAAASAPAAPAMSFEERLGTQWAVWVGGIAVALGGIFLVRYSIEQGLLGPGVRVTLGALLAVALIVAGEWARRTEQLAGIRRPADGAYSEHPDGGRHRRSPLPTSTPPTRSTISWRRARPSSCSAWSRSRRSRRRCCTDRRWPGSGSSAPMSRRCWCPPASRTSGRSTSTSPWSRRRRSRSRASGCGVGSRSRRSP